MPDNDGVLLETKKCVIAYLDILGAKNQIKNGEDTSLNLIKNCYDITEKLLKTQNHNANEFAKKNGIELNDIKCNRKIFSDNILVSIDISNATTELDDAVDYILHFVALFHLVVLEHANWLVRGAITIGNLYVGSDFAWGSGLVRVVELEERNAIYPRVILDSDKIQLIAIAKNLPLYISPVPIRIDPDNCHYISYEEVILPDSFTTQFSSIQKSLKKMTSDYFKSEIMDFKVMQKINWSIIYHNMICYEKGMSKFCVNLLEYESKEDI